MDLGIEGKVALVLSAGGGLGRVIGVALANEGASLAVADRNENSLAKTVAQIEATGVRAVNQSLDLMDIEALGSFLTRITGELGGVDILGNISGSPLLRQLQTCLQSSGSKNFAPWLCRSCT